jgi:hypothetical protein
MIRLWKKVTASPILRVVLLSSVLTAFGILILWNHHRVNRDFRQLKALLTDARCQAIGQQQVLIARFADKGVSITDNDTGAVIKTLDVPTLHQVNYDTTLGDDMIVFYDRGTGKYNKRVHGGDIRLKSWLGFKKNIVVRCTGFVMEGLYPEEGEDNAT